MKITNEKVRGNFSIRESKYGWKVIFMQKSFYDSPNSYIVPIVDNLKYKKAVDLCSRLSAIIIDTHIIKEEIIENRFEILDI